MKKAQTQTISVVLMTGIIISLAGAAYLWGKPLIEKRMTISDFTNALDFVLDLDKKIVDVVNSGSGSFEIDIPKGTLRVVPYGANDPDNNSIIYEILVSQPIAYNASTILIKTESDDPVGMYGEAEPRIITLSTLSTGGNLYQLRFKIHYRELITKTKGYRIALDSVSKSGNKRITVTFDKKEIQPLQASNNGDLILNYVKITVI